MKKMLRQLKLRCRPIYSRVPGFRALRLVYRLLRGVESRHTALLLMRPPKSLFQPYGATGTDRYPAIFQMARKLLGDGPELRIVSFGCSTGEEVFSLRRYFHQAKIAGLDINPHNIRLCRSRLRRNPDPGLDFRVAASTEDEPDASCDAIFAMAVFRHGDLNLTPPPPRCDHRIRFADFERVACDFARCLKPRGLLVMRNGMFRLADTMAMARFEPVFCLKNSHPGPLYGRGDCLLENAEDTGAIYRKLP